MAASNVYSSSGGSGLPVLEMIDITSQVDGTTTTFTIKSHKRNSLIVIWNGLIQLSEDITIVSSTQFSTSFIPREGEALSVIIQPL